MVGHCVGQNCILGMVNNNTQKAKSIYNGLRERGCGSERLQNQLSEELTWGEKRNFWTWNLLR